MTATAACSEDRALAALRHIAMVGEHEGRVVWQDECTVGGGAPGDHCFDLDPTGDDIDPWCDWCCAFLTLCAVASEAGL